MNVQKAVDLLGDSNFIGMCDHWLTNRRCPLEMVDLMLDWGLEEQSRCALWAATYADRPFYYYGRLWEKCGPYPHKDSGCWRWFSWSKEHLSTDSDELWGVINSEINGKRHATFPEAVAALLDHFRGYETGSAAEAVGEEGVNCVQS
jgi:hypothetical protein